MTRYVVASAVALVAALLLMGVLRNPQLRNHALDVPTDELLAYVVTADTGVALKLLQQTAEMRLTSWCVVERALPDERFDYGLGIEWQDESARPLGEIRLAFESRVSQPTASSRPSAFAARLAYSDALVTDSRTMRVVVAEFSGKRPTRLRIRRLEKDTRRVLVRATFPDRRQPLEVAAVDRRMSALEREELVRDRASVTYDELPYPLRSFALAAWQRRLDASGIEGKDYEVERLLIGTGRSSSGLITAQRPAVTVNRQHSVALNVLQPIHLELRAPPRTSLQLSSSSDDIPRTVVTSEGGQARIDFGRADSAQTLVVASNSETPVSIRILVDPGEVSAVLGPTLPAPDTELLEVSPLLRRSRYYGLDPTAPIALTPAVDQTVLGLTVRSTATDQRGRLEAEIDGERAAIELELVPSLFEQWSDATAASDEQRLFVQLPPAARRVLLRGSAGLRVAPFTVDPEVTTDRVAPEYDVVLPPEGRWKFARYDVDRAVALLPDNHAELVAMARQWELVAQSRIVHPDRRLEQPETTLVPVTTTVSRHVIEPVRWGPEFPLPEDAVVALDRPRRGYVPAKGPRAGHVRLSYRLSSSDVGQELQLLVDRAPVHGEDTLANSGQFDVPVSSGTHDFEIRGAGADAQMLLDVVPLEAAGALRRRAVHRILPHAVLRFLIQKQAEARSIVITTYQQKERRVAMRYAVEAHREADFLHAVTPMHGDIAGIALEAPGVWFWEVGPERSLHRHRSTIALGNDVKPGLLAFVLRNTNSTPVYVSVVVVGQANPSRPQLQRFWTTEEP